MSKACDLDEKIVSFPSGSIPPSPEGVNSVAINESACSENLDAAEDTEDGFQPMRRREE